MPAPVVLSFQSRTQMGMQGGMAREHGGKKNKRTKNRVLLINCDHNEIRKVIERSQEPSHKQIEKKESKKWVFCFATAAKKRSR
jgi:hypothetical protein